MSVQRVDLLWQGSFGFHEPNENRHIEGTSGVYLLTIEHDGKQYAHYAGKATNCANRIPKHREEYISGKYWIHDPVCCTQYGILCPPIYNPRCHEAFCKDKADFWVKILNVYVAALGGYSGTELCVVESALCYRFSAIPSAPYSLFFDHAFRRNKLKQSVTLVSAFASLPVEGLPGEICCVPGQIPTVVR